MLIGNLIPWRNKARDSKPEVSGSESPVSRLHSEMDRLFERFFSEPWRDEWSLTSGWWRPWGEPWPSLDVTESEKGITISAEVPGVDPKNIDVSLSGDVLTIAGEKKQETEERRGGYYHTERSFGTFRRSVPLPSSVDPEKISAEYENGVLKIRLRKTETQSAKRIPVATSSK